VEHEAKPERVLDPKKWAATGGVIAVVALALAFGADQGLGLLLALPEGASVIDAVAPASDASQPRRSRTRDSSRALSKNTYLDPILRRNIFDSTAVGSTAAADVDPGIDGRRSSLDVTLLATVVAEPASFSSALISSGDRGNAEVRGYGIGDELLGEATVVRIEQKKVVLRRNDGTIEYIDMGGEGAKGGGSSRRSSKTPEGEDEAGITKTGDYSWEVDESVISGALGNIDSLISQVRATPHKGPDGEIDGFRLSAIRRGSLLQKLGIKNGDVIHGVNGTPLTSATGAMGAFQSMQSERSFSFDVTRRNQKNTFEYSIR
jgi:general secretion pathway protein C